MKKIKVKLVRFDKIAYDPNGYFLRFLKNNPKFEIVKENQDLVIINIFSFEKVFQKYKNQKILVFSGENIYSTGFRRLGIQILKKFSLHNSLLKHFFPLIQAQPYKDLLNHYPYKNIFWILCNDIKQERVFNFPYAFDTHLEKIQDLIEIKKQNLYKEEKKIFCAFVVANPNAKDRIHFFKKLSKYKKIDSLGPVFHNTKIPEYLIKKYKHEEIDLDTALKTIQYSFVTNAYLLNQELFREYKFVICFENSYFNNYVTEKLPNVMMANSIGIYRGAPNIGEFFNTKSFINFDDYGSDEAMIKKIIELDQDDEKYQKMLQEPFFVNNEIPLRLKTAKEDLKNFILSIIE